jgi:hypothetical protein
MPHSRKRKYVLEKQEVQAKGMASNGHAQRHRVCQLINLET